MKKSVFSAFWIRSICQESNATIIRNFFVMNSFFRTNKHNNRWRYCLIRINWQFRRKGRLNTTYKSELIAFFGISDLSVRLREKYSSKKQLIRSLKVVLQAIIMAAKAFDYRGKQLLRATFGTPGLSGSCWMTQTV